MMSAELMQIGGAVMVEDTSLYFNAYKGLPGKSWLPTCMFYSLRPLMEPQSCPPVVNLP